MNRGKNTKVAKLLLEIPFRELHNDLVNPDSGLPRAIDPISGKPLISDTALRYLVPPELRRMTARHEQMCGCESCIITKHMHLSLKAWRKRRVGDMKKQLFTMEPGPEKDRKVQEFDTYKAHVLPDGKDLHEHPKDAISEVFCPIIGETGLHNWGCVLRKCKNCPEYNIPTAEKGTESDLTLPTIKFHIYQVATNCSLHKKLPTYSKVCETCGTKQDPLVEKLGRISTRKYLTIMERPIDEFITISMYPL